MACTIIMRAIQVAILNRFKGISVYERVLCMLVLIHKVSKTFLESYLRYSVRTYSVSSLETTIFHEIGKNFRRTFLSPLLIPYMETLNGGKRGHVLPP